MREKFWKGENIEIYSNNYIYIEGEKEKEREPECKETTYCFTSEEGVSSLEQGISSLDTDDPIQPVQEEIAIERVK